MICRWSCVLGFVDRRACQCEARKGNPLAFVWTCTAVSALAWLLRWPLGLVEQDELSVVGTDHDLGNGSINAFFVRKFPGLQASPQCKPSSLCEGSP